MGLFVAEDGYYHGWLAAVLCCCAAVDVDEHPIEKTKSRPSTGVAICNEQPLPLTALPAYVPASRQSRLDRKDDKLYNHEHALRKIARISDRPPSLRPLEFESHTTIDHPSKRHSKKPSSGHRKRPSIGAPTAFRRLEYTEGQRAGLIPLRLGPVVLKDAPISTPSALAPTPLATIFPGSDNERSSSMDGLLTESLRGTYRTLRDSPYQRCQQRSSDRLSSLERSTSTAASSFTASTLEHRSNRPPVSTHSSSGSLRRQALEANASIGTSRPSSERNRLQRKRSLPNVRTSHMERGEMEVDKEILELNTIIEERRVEEARRSTSSNKHVAAIAPSMQVRARSETLRDIGSGLARPYTAREFAPAVATFIPAEKTPRPSTARVSSRSSSRVSGWLSGLVSSSSTTHTPPSQEPFYKCMPNTRPRAQSETSLTSSITALESPSLTTASSPTSKAHSRSVTAESRITPLSPLPAIFRHDYADLKEIEEWPMMAVPPSQVGLAL